MTTTEPRTYQGEVYVVNDDGDLVSLPRCSGGPLRDATTNEYVPCRFPRGSLPSTWTSSACPTGCQFYAAAGPQERTTDCWRLFETNGACAGEYGARDGRCPAYRRCMERQYGSSWESRQRSHTHGDDGIARDGGGGTNFLNNGCPSAVGRPGIDAPDNNAKKLRVADIMESMGATQECKTAFDNEVNANQHMTDTVLAACSTPIGNIGPTADVSTSSTENSIRSNMAAAGCTEIMMSVNDQVISEINMTCELNNTTSTMSVSQTQSQQITVAGAFHPEGDIEFYRTMALGKPKQPDALDYAGYSNGVELLDMAAEIYSEANRIWNRSMFTGRMSTFDNNTFRITGAMTLKVVTELEASSSANLVENMEATIRAQAESEIQRNVGFGSTDTANMRQLVQNAIDSNREAIATMINNVVSNTHVRSNTMQGVTITFPGQFTFSNNTITLDSQVTMMVESLTESARQFARQLAMNILSESTATARYERASGGVAEALKAIGEAQAALRRANKSGGGLGGGLIVLVIIGAAIFFILPKLISGGVGIAMIAAVTVVIYIIVALIFDLWPFSSSENKRVHVPMEVPSLDQSFGKNLPNVEYSRENQDIHIHNPNHKRREHVPPRNKTKLSAGERVYRQR